jgi:hypothetical protein
MTPSLVYGPISWLHAGALLGCETPHSAEGRLEEMRCYKALLSLGSPRTPFVDRFRVADYYRELICVPSPKRFGQVYITDQPRIESWFR